MPEELRPQIPQIKQMLNALAIPVLELVGYEADDILANARRDADEITARRKVGEAVKDLGDQIRK